MRKPARKVFLSLLFIGGVLFLWRVRKLALPFLIAAGIAYILHPLVALLEKRAVPRYLAIILVYLVIGVSLGLVFFAIRPFILREWESILDVIPEQKERLEGARLEALKEMSRLPWPALAERLLNEAAVRLEQMIMDVAGRVDEVLLTVATGFFHLLLSPFLAYFLLRDWPGIKKGFISLFPAKKKDEVLHLALEINEVISGFLRGQLIIAFIVGTASALGFLLLGIRYSILLGILVGAFEIVPYFGPVIGSTPAVIFALLDSPIKAVWVVLLLIVINQLEAAFLSPKVVGMSVGLHPLTVIFSLLAGAEIMGILGMLIAVPVAGVFKVILSYTFQHMIQTPNET
jgi:predicted PurR-regulated permease PerM